MEDGPTIEVSNLTRFYGQLLAVDHINFSVARGEFFGFLGPNGAGKTTTVSMLTTILTPSEGTAKVHGHDIIQNPYGARENIGVVPENSNIYIDLSAWDNLVFSGELYGISRHRRESRAEELLETLGLYDRRLLNHLTPFRSYTDEVNRTTDEIFQSGNVVTGLCRQLLILSNISGSSLPP